MPITPERQEEIGVQMGIPLRYLRELRSRGIFEGSRGNYEDIADAARDIRYRENAAQRAEEDRRARNCANGTIGAGIIAVVAAAVANAPAAFNAFVDSLNTFGDGVYGLWQSAPSTTDVSTAVAEVFRYAQEPATDCIGVVQSSVGVVAPCLDPISFMVSAGGIIFLGRLGLFMHNVQNIDNAMPGSHHNCDYYNLKKVRNCLLEALDIMIYSDKEIKKLDSDKEIKKLVDEVNRKRREQNDPNEKEISGFNRFVLEKILKEIGHYIKGLLKHIVFKL